MFLKSTYVSLLLILIIIYTYGQGQPVSPRLTGQEGAAGAQVIINEVNTDRYPQVRIFTTVLKNGAPLKGLSASDFRVREDEVDQEPITVEPKLPPLSVVLTLDTSGSMAKRMKETQAAAQSFLDILGSNDSAQVVSFAREVKRLTTMSTNRQAAREAIGNTAARGDTALYDALYESIQLVKDRTGRKAIVLLSDGVDDDGTGKPLSKHTVREVIGLARAVNVPIYVLGLGTEIDEAVLTEVAKETGALYFNAPQARDLTALYAKIGEQLAGQYAISYTSNLPADGMEHRVVLTSQGVASMKTYKAPGEAVAKMPEPSSTREPEASAPGTGTFDFKWPGRDCWQVFRGDMEVASHCGSRTQVLQAGTYTVKPRHKAVFEPFNITIQRGLTHTVAIGGVFEFKWPSRDCWQVFRGDMEVASHCGSRTQVLQAGTYTVKPRHKAVFEPFNITIHNGSKTAAP